MEQKMKFWFRTREDTPDLRATVVSLNDRVKQYEEIIGTLQHSVDILTNPQDEDIKGSNRYPSYESRLCALSQMYNGTGPYGFLYPKSIINFRSVFAVGGGIKITMRNGFDGKDKAGKKAPAKATETTSSPEKEFIDKFIKWNDLNGELPQRFAEEAEIEGKALVKLVAKGSNKEDATIEIRHLPYSAFRYKINLNSDDYTVVDSIEHYAPVPVESTFQTGVGQVVTGDQVIIRPDRFIFRTFAGRAIDPICTNTRVALALEVMEDLDKAFADWREANALFAAPTPHIDCEDPQAAKEIEATLRRINWTIGKLLVTSKSKFNLVSISRSGVESLEQEIVTLTKALSGVSGIPIHMLGMPDLMSNRSTADSLMELINASTSSERQIWTGIWRETIQKAMVLHNTLYGTTLDPESFEVQIPQISNDRLKQLIEIWLPLFEGRVISSETMRSKVPDIDPETEQDRVAEDEEHAMATAIPTAAGGHPGQPGSPINSAMQKLLGKKSQPGANQNE